MVGPAFGEPTKRGLWSRAIGDALRVAEAFTGSAASSAPSAVDLRDLPDAPSNRYRAEDPCNQQNGSDEFKQTPSKV